MEAKLFEIRDVATFIVMLAIKLEPECEADRYLLTRAGYGREAKRQGLCRISGGDGESHCDPFKWPNNTLKIAHQWFQDNWEKLESGAVIDVEFIQGDSAQPKTSERFEEEKL